MLIELVRDVGYKTRPIDRDFLQKPNEYPVTGEHNGHKVRAGGMTRLDGEASHIRHQTGYMELRLLSTGKTVLLMEYAWMFVLSLSLNGH